MSQHRTDSIAVARARPMSAFACRCYSTVSSPSSHRICSSSVKVMEATGGSVQSCNDTWSLLWLPIDLILEDAMD
ncbi:hypothetical protein PIB30_079937 [Stylosanthes scabra]|uniref:Uncharacterized protein n=1 Tax=Stylosanthes scabra TaxID=79078 RepID=A0ABU6YPI1_9FABA|nr:hypothetical protein [Stylosanthes scabra]